MLNDLSWLKRVKIVDENGNLINESNPLSVQHIDFRKLLWTSEDDFNTGSLTDTEIIETGDEAYVQLLEYNDNTDNINYNTLSEYTLSDISKVEILSGFAKLKSLTGAEMNWSFATPSNYTYDSNLIEIINSKAKLKDLRPAQSTFYCDYTTDSGNWGNGNLAGTLQNGATVTAGKLNTEGAIGRSCDYDSQLNADIPQIGCCRFGYVPQYSGNPLDYQVMFFLGHDGTFTNSIYIFHDISGLIYVAMYDNTGSLIMAHNVGSWSPTSGVEYEFEVNWNITAGATRLFIDGVQIGGVAVQTGTHNNFDIIRVGNNYNNTLTSYFKINYVIFFDTVQHTSNYTPNGQAGLPTNKFSNYNPTIVPNTGFIFSENLSAFAHIIETTPPRNVQYQISSDDGTTWKWWNGTSWAIITGSQTDTWYYNNESNLASEINTNIGTLAVSGIFKFKGFIHCDLGTDTPLLDNVCITEPITYSTDDNLYIDTKDTSQIAPVINLDWISTDIIDNTLPGSSDIKIMLSNDGRVSWLTYTGGSWQAPINATQRQYGTSVTDAEANFSSLPLGDATLDVRLFLYTNDIFISPSVENINVVSHTGFAMAGTYESAIYDSTYFSLDWGIVNFSLVLPTGTTIIITVRASNDSDDLGSYGSALSNGADSNITGRYMQWKADFVTTNGYSSKLEDFALNFMIPTRQEVRP